jgi:hypothetical protein
MVGNWGHVLVYLPPGTSSKHQHQLMHLHDWLYKNCMSVKITPDDAPTSEMMAVALSCVVVLPRYRPEHG